MIVWTSVRKDIKRYVCSGDQFILTVKDEEGNEDSITEEITDTRVIDIFGSFRFANDDGTIPAPHLCGFFGDQSNLPDAIVNALTLEDLEPDQLENFKSTVGTRPLCETQRRVIKQPNGLWAIDKALKIWRGLWK